MKLAFLPGKLVLRKDGESHVVEVDGEEILRTRSEKSALKTFNKLRADMELRFPSRQPTKEEMAELLRQAIGDSLVGHNSLGGRKKKTTAGGTRTFGG